MSYVVQKEAKKEREATKADVTQKSVEARLIKKRIKSAKGPEAEKLLKELKAAEASLAEAHARALEACSAVMGAAVKQWLWGAAGDAVLTWKGRIPHAQQGKLLAARNEAGVPPHMRCRKCQGLQSEVDGLHLGMTKLQVAINKGRYSHGLHVAQIVAFEWAQAQRKIVVASWRRGFLIWMKQENLTCKVPMLTWGDY